MSRFIDYVADVYLRYAFAHMQSATAYDMFILTLAHAAAVVLRRLPRFRFFATFVTTFIVATTTSCFIVPAAHTLLLFRVTRSMFTRDDHRRRRFYARDVGDANIDAPLMRHAICRRLFAFITFALSPRLITISARRASVYIRVLHV